MAEFVKTALSDLAVEYFFPDLNQEQVLSFYCNQPDKLHLLTGMDLLVSDRRLTLICRDTELAIPVFDQALQNLEDQLLLFNKDAAQSTGGAKLHLVKVIYGGESGPDLPQVAQACGLTESEWVKQHQLTEFIVQFNGFLPGFSYLAGADRLTQVPRLAKPRTRVPKGSLAVAAGYCGVYPSESPGGWRVVGLTTTELFNPDQEPPALLSPGDRVRFTEVNP